MREIDFCLHHYFLEHLKTNIEFHKTLGEKLNQSNEEEANQNNGQFNVQLVIGPRDECRKNNQWPDPQVYHGPDTVRWSNCVMIKSNVTQIQISVTVSYTLETRNISRLRERVRPQLLLSLKTGKVELHGLIQWLHFHWAFAPYRKFTGSIIDLVKAQEPGDRCKCKQTIEKRSVGHGSLDTHLLSFRRIEATVQDKKNKDENRNILLQAFNIFGFGVVEITTHHPIIWLHPIT